VLADLRSGSGEVPGDPMSVTFDPVDGRCAAEQVGA